MEGKSETKMKDIGKEEKRQRVCHEGVSYPGDDGVLSCHHLSLSTHHSLCLLYVVLEQAVVEHPSIVNVHISFFVCECVGVNESVCVCVWEGNVCECVHVRMLVRV